MKIKKSLKGSELTIAVEGRLDSITAPELESELNDSYEGLTKIIMDFAEVNYMSSAGLRVLIQARKMMKKNDGTIEVNNVQSDIYAVLDATGCTKMMKVNAL